MVRPPNLLTGSLLTWLPSPRQKMLLDYTNSVGSSSPRADPNTISVNRTPTTGISSAGTATRVQANGKVTAAMIYSVCSCLSVFNAEHLSRAHAQL